MFTGRLIYGNENQFVQHKQKVIDAPISQEVIEYNLRKSDLQKDYLSSYEDDDRMKELCVSYIQSFSQNAEQLSLGNKPLTLENLKQMYAK